MVEAAEPVAGSFHLLDDQVQAFGLSVRSAGSVMVEDLLAPPPEVAAEGLDLGKSARGAGTTTTTTSVSGNADR